MVKMSTESIGTIFLVATPMVWWSRIPTYVVANDNKLLL